MLTGDLGGGVEIRTAVPGDAHLLAADPRPPDVEEVYAARGEGILPSAQRAIRMSTVAWAGLVDGELALLFGAWQPSLLSQRAAVWALGTRLVDRRAVTFIRHSQRYIDHMLDAYGTLENYVDTRNRRAIRWLRTVGATIHPAEPWGRFGLPFHHFEIKRHV